MRAIGTSDKLDGLYSELEQVKAMSESEACAAYNCDTKEEIIEAIEEEITPLENCQCEYDDDYEMWDDHGFANEADYIRWRYGA